MCSFSGGVSMRMKSADDGTTTVSATGATAAAPPKSRKFEKVYQSFKSELLHSAPGTPIASVRELMRRYQVSQITVTRALKQLQEDGLVESKVGYGSFRSGKIHSFIQVPGSGPRPDLSCIVARHTQVISSRVSTGSSPHLNTSPKMNFCSISINSGSVPSPVRASPPKRAR